MGEGLSSLGSSELFNLLCLRLLRVWICNDNVYS